MSKKWTIGVDVDGVLHSYTSPWTQAHELPDPPVEGAIEWLNEITKRLEVVLFTTRGATPQGSDAVRAWLELHGYTGPQLQVTDKKPPALAYLDDRAVRFEGPGTFPTADEIFALRPWNKPPTDA